MTFLQRAREKATEVARDAADASARAAESLTTKAQDPETHARLEQAAEQMRAKATDPVTHAKVRAGLTEAGRRTRTVVERIDPGLLADVIIKATALQEVANAKLREKGSVYRIGGISVTASLPPGVSFSINRISEDASSPGEDLRSSAEILADEAALGPGDGGADAIVSLDGDDDGEVSEVLPEMPKTAAVG